MRNFVRVALSALLLVVAAVAGASAQVVSIASLPPGTINNVQAQALAKVVADNSQLRVRVITYNSAAAVLAAVENGQAEFGFMSNDEIGAAIRGEGEHEGRAMPSLRYAATILPLKMGLFVRASSDIETLADLEGKRIPAGWLGFRQGLDTMSAFLAAGGLDFDRVESVEVSNLIRAADDFNAGRVDATVFAASAPKVEELHASVSGGIRFLGFEDSAETASAIQSVRPEFERVELTAQERVPGITDPTAGIGVDMAIVTGEGVDAEMVGAIVGAIAENRDDLIAAHPSFNAFDPQIIAKEHPGGEYHAGSLAYFGRN